jgi:2-(1,2-epoxy-1,2-dihydrophenyl)acetyl-CoA isomerase
MNDTVLLDRAGAIATLTLNRPAVRNALDEAMIEALIAHTAALADDDAIRVVVLRGAGSHFMAGGDLNVFAAALHRPPAERQPLFQRLVERIHVAIETIHRMPQPVVAQVQGAAAGFGLSLMNACDLVVAADDAYFASAYRQIGLTPDGGGSYALPRVVGLRKAMEIFLLGERFDAATARALGLVNRIVPAVELESATAAIASTLAAGPALATRNAKRLLRDSPNRSLSEQLQAEAVSFAQCAASDDFVEGVDAFLHKRAPRFVR